MLHDRLLPVSEVTLKASLPGDRLCKTGEGSLSWVSQLAKNNHGITMLLPSCELCNLWFYETIRLDEKC